MVGTQYVYSNRYIVYFDNYTVVCLRRDKMPEICMGTMIAFIIISVALVLGYITARKMFG